MRRAAASAPAAQRAGIVLLGLVIAAMGAHRLFLAVSTDFPINDGGLFYLFVKATAVVFPDLPAQVSYNGLSIPFAYPPLSFWIGALLTKLGADPLTVVHLLPIGMNFLYVLLFALLLVRQRQAPLFIAAVLLFLAANLQSFEWLVMGGGLSRGLGSIFLMLTLLAVRLPDPETRSVLPTGRLILAGAAVAGAILSHLEWGIDAAACVVLSRALASPNGREFVRSNLIAGISALLLILPWLLLVIDRSGIGPLHAASGSSPWTFSNYLEHLVWFAIVSLANLMIPIGLILLVRRRDLFWPLFLLLCVLLTPRHARTPASLALAVLAAQGTFWIGGRLLKLMSSRTLAFATTAAMALVLAGLQLNRNFVASGDVVRPLDTNERAAMAWVAGHHPADSYLVLTKLPWWYDRSAEWFPVLADTRSVNTLQGREWLPGRAYDRWYQGDMAMKTSKGCASLLRSIRVFDPPRYIWAQSRDDCFATAGFPIVYRNDAVTIYGLARPESGQDRPDRARNDQHIHPE